MILTACEAAHTHTIWATRHWSLDITSLKTSECVTQLYYVHFFPQYLHLYSDATGSEYCEMKAKVVCKWLYGLVTSLSGFSSSVWEVNADFSTDPSFCNTSHFQHIPTYILESKHCNMWFDSSCHECDVNSMTVIHEVQRMNFSESFLKTLFHKCHINIHQFYE